MRLRHRPHARILLLATAGLLIVAWLAPPYFHAGRYRRLLEAGLENKLGRPVELGTVSFRLLPHPGFSINQVVIKEDPRFGSEPFARMDGLECDLRWRSLWGSRLDCARILLEHPTLNMVRNGQGEWNLKDFFVRSNTVTRIRSLHAATHSPEAFHLDFEDARLNFTTGITKRPFAVTGLSGGLALDPSRGSVRFDFAGTPIRMDLPPPAPGAVELSGEWKPGSNFEGPFRATLHTTNSLLYGWMPLLTGRNPEIYGLADAAIQLSGSMDRLWLTGDIRLDQLHRFDALPPLSSMPVGISFRGLLDRTNQELSIQHAEATFADSHLELGGAIDRIGGLPKLDLVLAVETSQLHDVLDMASRLSGHEAAWDASGRLGGLLTIQGPWRDTRYGGFITVRSMQLQAHGLSLSVRKASIRVDQRGAHLLPAHLSLGAGIQCIAEGTLFAPLGSRNLAAPADLTVEMPVPHQSRVLRRSISSTRRYVLTFSAHQVPLRRLLRLAKSLGDQGAAELDAGGTADAIVRLSGSAWPLAKPSLSARAELHQGRLLIPGLTEPLRLTRFHLQVMGKNIQVDPLVARMGPVAFSGWLKHEGRGANPWMFDASTPKLSMERASLWFTVLGHQRPVPILDLIPWLRSFVSRRTAGRNIFASVNARGRFESRVVTFRTVRLERVSARVAIAQRVASIEDLTFRVADGAGRGSAKIDFRRVPVLIAGTFRLDNGALDEVGWRLPAALAGIHGTMSATGRFITRGLTRQEMSAGLGGQAGIRLTNVSLGSFDPLQAFAHAAPLGLFLPNPGAARFRSATLNLQIHDQRVLLMPLQLKLAGAAFDIHGECDFNGKANVYVRGDLSRVKRLWLRDSAAQPTAGNSAQELAWSVPGRGTPLPGHHRPGFLTAAPGPQFLFDPPRGRRAYTAVVHLAGPIHKLTVIREVPPASRP